MTRFYYAIFDMKTNEYYAPWTSANDEVAKREFGTAMTHPESYYQAYRPDFELYRVGQWDSSNGNFYTYDCPTFICAGRDYMNRPDPYTYFDGKNGKWIFVGDSESGGAENA